MLTGAGKGKAAVVLGMAFALALAGSAVAGPVNFVPAGYAGYASAGFTEVPVAALVNDYYAVDPNSGNYIEGTLTSGVLRNPGTGEYLFYYNIVVDLGSDAIDTFQISNFNPPMYTQGITAMGYNTDVTGADANLIPTTAMAWVPPGPPFARYGFDTGDGIPDDSVTEVFYIAGGSTQIVSGTGVLINSVSAQVEAQVNIFAEGIDPVTPEPATLLLIGGGLAAIAFMRRRR